MNAHTKKNTRTHTTAHHSHPIRTMFKWKISITLTLYAASMTLSVFMRHRLTADSSFVRFKHINYRYFCRNLFCQWQIALRLCLLAGKHLIQSACEHEIFRKNQWRIFDYNNIFATEFQTICQKKKTQTHRQTNQMKPDRFGGKSICVCVCLYANAYQFIK